MTIRKFKINIEGKSFVAEVEELGGVSVSTPVSRPSTSAAISTPVASAAGNAIVSPMPGKIISIHVKKGQQVKIGESVLILEAMKMEQEIKSSLEGIVEEISVSEGDTVKKEQALIIIS